MIIILNFYLKSTQLYLNLLAFIYARHHESIKKLKDIYKLLSFAAKNFILA
jgi:hypothetical protein